MTSKTPHRYPRPSTEMSFASTSGIMTPQTPAQRSTRRISSFSPALDVHSPSVRHITRSRESGQFMSAGVSSTSETLIEAAPGDLVEVPGGWHGHVKYIGPVDSRSGTFLGIDLIALDADKGRNDGTHNGVAYFSAKSSTSGMFVPQGRCRVIEPSSRKEHSNVSTRPGSRQQLHIRPNSRMRTASSRVVSGQIQAAQPSTSAAGLQDYFDDRTAAAKHQKLLNENARLTKDLSDLRETLREEQKVRAVHTQEMEELLTTVAELEALQLSQSHDSSKAEVDQLRDYLADRESKIEQLRAEAEVRRKEFREATEHQEATIEELKTLHTAQINEWQEKHDDMEERLLSSGNDNIHQSESSDHMETLQAQLLELSNELDALVEQQERARQDIDIANSRIAELEQENHQLEELLAASERAKPAMEQTPQGDTRSVRRVVSIEALPDHHPQKRQTIDFLETEIERLKEEKEAVLQNNATTGADSYDQQSVLDELAELRQACQRLQEENNKLTSKESEITRLKIALEAEENAKKALESKHEQMEETLEQTIMHMNSKSPRSSRQLHFSPERMPVVPTRHENDLRSPRADRGGDSDIPSSGILWCEYCESAGHDIVSCKAVFGSADATPAKAVTGHDIMSDMDEDEMY